MRRTPARRRPVGLLVVLASAPVVHAASSGGLIFYVGFEGAANLKTGYVASADATVAAGDRAAEVLDGELRFEPGRRGNALLAGDGCARVRYNAEKNLLPQRGTLEFWLCAKDWEFHDGQYHVFFEAHGPDGSLLKYFKTPKGYYCNFWIGKGGTDAQGRNKFTVMDNSFGFAPGSLTRFTMGDRPFEGSHGAHTLIDELSVYDRALNEREVMWIYEHAADRARGKGLPAVIGAPEATLTCVPSKGEIHVSVNTGASVANLTGTATLNPAAGTEPAVLTETDHQRCEGVIRYKSLPPGRYSVRVALNDPLGAEIGNGEKSFVVPDASLWLGNTIGLSETPPRPFTPVTVRDDAAGGLSISCWGRTYRLGGLGLPETIVTRGQQNLASGIKFLAAGGDGDVQWRTNPVEVKETRAVRVVLSGSAESGLGKMTWTCTGEYDGMLRCDLELIPRENAALDKLELRFPLRAANAKLVWTRDWKRGLLPDGQGALVRRPWNPYVWLGDEDRGVVLFCESESAWQEVDGQPGFLLERNGQTVEAVWRFANAGVPWKMKKPWKFSFGVEATPVKDTTGWRRFRLAGLAVTPPEYHNVWVKHDGAKPPAVGHCRYFGYPEPSVSVETYRGHVTSMKGNGPHKSGPCLVLQHILPSCLSGRAPEAFYGAEWRCSPYPHGQWAGEGSIYGTMLLIAPTPTWRDFIAWKIDRFMNETGIDGIYADFSILNVGNNSLTGFPCDVRDGKARSFWPFFATRELYKRLYTMHKQRGEDTFFFGHVANAMYVPFAAFLDGALDGEHLNADLSKDYPELLPLDLVQVQYAGKNLGVNTYFLPLKVPVERRKNWETASKPYMIGMALLHDYGLYWGSFDRKPTLEAAYEFGIREAEFIPYWRSGDLVGGQMADVKCSIYRRPDVGALLVVANVSRQKREVSLLVDWTKLTSAKMMTALDAYTRGPIRARGEVLIVDVAPLSHRMIVIGSP